VLRAAPAIVARQANAPRNQEVAIYRFSRIETCMEWKALARNRSSPSRIFWIGCLTRSGHIPAWMFCGRLRALFKTGDSGLLSIRSYWNRTTKPALAAESRRGENGARRVVSFGLGRIDRTTAGIVETSRRPPGQERRLGPVLKIDEGRIREHSDEVVRSTVEEKLSAPLGRRGKPAWQECLRLEPAARTVYDWADTKGTNDL
jgi:hypothetical protein